MDKCPKCGTALRVGRSYYSFVNDDTPKKQTEAYVNLEMVCTNKTLAQDEGGKTVVKPCPMYAGDDLSKPLKVIHTVKNKIH